MVIVICVLLIALLMGAAALTEALATRSHANLDTRQRRALQAADAGIQAILYHENQLDLGTLDLTGGTGVLGTLADCLVPNLNTGLPANSLISLSVAAGGACAIGQKNGANVLFSTAIPIGDHAYYNAEFIPSAAVASGTSGIQFVGGKIVSIGIDDNGNASDPNRYVRARVQASIAPVVPFNTVEANHDLTFVNPLATSVFNGTARAGHRLYFDMNGAAAYIFSSTNLLGNAGVISPTTLDVGCSDATTGKPYSIIPGLLGSTLLTTLTLGSFNVASPTTCSSPYWFTRSPITVSTSKADCPSSCSTAFGASYLSGTNEIYNTNAATTLSFGPGDYVFCNFETNGPVNVTATASSAPVRIFIDTNAAHCPGSINHGSLQPGFKATGSNFIATQGFGGLVGGVTGTLSPSQVQVYVVGGGQVTSTATLADAFFLYAPQATVSISSTVSFTGTVIGYDVTMKSLLYTQSLGLNNYPISSSLGIFHVSQYTQCTNAPTALTGTVATDIAGC